MSETVTAKMHSLICHNIEPSFQDKQAQELNYNCLQIAMPSKKNTEQPTKEIVRNTSLFLTYHPNHPEYPTYKTKDECYTAHLPRIPHQHIFKWNQNNNYPFKPSHAFFWDTLACPIIPESLPHETFKAEMKRYNNAKIVDWNPDDPISYYEQLTDAQKKVLNPFAHKDNQKLTAYDITMAASCVQVYFNLIHKAGFGDVQFTHSADGEQELSENSKFLLTTLAEHTHEHIRDIIYWLARIMAHRDYYFDSSTSQHKQTYADFDEEEKKRFDLIIGLFIDITPIIRINEYTLPAEFKFVEYSPNAKEPTTQKMKEYMQSLKFETVTHHFRSIGKANAISACYLGQQSYYATWHYKDTKSDYIWACLEYPDPQLATNSNHNIQPEPTDTLKLKKRKWDTGHATTTKDGKEITVLPTKIFEKRIIPISGAEAQEAWAKTTVLLPIAIIFNLLQGWRTDDTTQSSPNRAYDYRFITLDESKMLAQDFPSCIDPSLITKKVYEVPLTNEQKAAPKKKHNSQSKHKQSNKNTGKKEKRNRKATQNKQQKPQSNTTEFGKTTKNQKRKNKASLKITAKFSLLDLNKTLLKS
jgi:hypothetical protein